MVLLVAGAVAVLAGCTRTPEHVTLPRPVPAGSTALSPAGTPGVTAAASHGMPAGTRESPITWVVRPLPAPAMQVVLRGYANYLATYVRLVGAPDPGDAAIGEVSTGAAYVDLVADVRGLAAEHRAIRGPLRSVPVVSTLRGDTAVVDDCADLSHFADATSARVGSATQPIRATLTRVATGWLVSAVSRPAGGCPAR